MKRLPLTQKHMDKLSEYGLQGISRAACTCLLFSPGETVLYEGEPIRWYSIVVGGRAKVCKTASNGRTLILCYYMSEGIIGEVELLTGRETTTTSVTAITEFECLVIDYEACRKELAENVVFLRKLGAALAEKLVQSSDGFSSSALCPGMQRLSAYILQNAYRNVFCDVLTDVSCSIGMSYRHMFRLLQQLCAEGVLEKKNNGYWIRDAGRLMRLSAMTPDAGHDARGRIE